MNIDAELPERLKRSLRLKVGENSISFNSRMVQDYYFKKHKRYYFVVQVLEKYLLNLIKFLEKDGEQRDRIFSIIKSRQGNILID